MKRFAFVLLVACGGSQSAAPPPTTEPIPSVASVTAPTASAEPVVDAGAPASRGFHVVHETVHATSQMIARIGDGESVAGKVGAIEPKVGALADKAADSACYVATGLSHDTNAECVAKIDAVSGTTLTVTVDADFEDDSMQSRSRTHVAMHGSITIDATTHAIVRASFTGVERFQFRAPCEKNDGCERCDPLVKTAGCKPVCFCPFKNVGTADVETSYGP